MLKDLIAGIWRRLPRPVRRWGTRVMNTRFTASAGAVIVDGQGRVLLLKHRFRPGSGWGIPGGFMDAGEQPEETLRRELREEIGLELESAEIILVRSFKDPLQLEILFRARPNGTAKPRSMEVQQLGWFSPDSLPQKLSTDQRELIKQALESWSEKHD